MVFGTHGGLSKIEIVKVLDGGKKLQKVAAVDIKISSAVIHLDWSSDGNTVAVNSEAFELMWLDVNTKKVLNASSVKDTDWYTWTARLGFPVQGIWPPCSDYMDTNSVCRSNARTIVATADDNSKVNIFRYPCTVEHAGFTQYMGHSSHVTKVKFSHDDRFLVSTGGNDKTVLIWETDFGFGDDTHAQADSQHEELK